MNKNNTQLPADWQDAIQKDADEYARTYSGTKLIKRPYIAGATAYATKLLGSQQNERFLAQIKEELSKELNQAQQLIQKIVDRYGITADKEFYNEIKTFLDGK